MPKTMVNCPGCRQPIQADLKQLFDLNTDPVAKQTLLTGAFNIVQCSLCGFQGNLATPIVYHDPQKELLLTFVPPEIGIPQTEQEKLLGSLINQVVNNLPQELRKGYLFRPQPVLTLQGLVERVLEADGITKEYIQEQQQKLELIQRLQDATENVRVELARQEEKQMDAQFFTLISNLIQSAAASGEEEAARKLSDLQKSLLPLTTYGKRVLEQTAEVEAAIRSLKEAGQELTREKLLQLVINAPNEVRLRALVSLARPGMDYVFFQTLSERLEKAQGDERKKFIELRERLLELTAEIDKQLEARFTQSRQLLDRILQSNNISETTLQFIPAIDEFFLQELNTSLEKAQQKNDQEKLDKLQKVIAVIQQVSTVPPAIQLIEDLLAGQTDDERRKLLDDHRELISPEWINDLANLAYQAQSEGDNELANQVRAIHRLAENYLAETGNKKD